MTLNKDAIVLHSGGMDSSISLALALRQSAKQKVLSLSFSYGQRHSLELAQAAKICHDWDVDHVVIELSCLQVITENALMNKDIEINHLTGEAPNTLVVGRNGLMLRLAAIHADYLHAQFVYAGVIEVESANSGYRDCSRDYIDKLQEILRIDLANPQFEIRTPVIAMTKCQTLELAHELGVLSYLLQETISCYRGISGMGCETCPSCKLRNDGLKEFLRSHPTFVTPYPFVYSDNEKTCV